MHGKSLNGYPFRVETNVNAKVVGPNHELKQNIDKHNMATANLTEGVVKFLRGEFTESYISGLIPNIGNDFNIADQYIPAYMGIGVAGVDYTEDGKGLVLTSSNGFAPSYADQQLISEILPMAKPGRAIVSKSVRSNGSLSQAASLIISTAYHFEDQAESQTFVLEPDKTVYTKDTKFYLADSLYPGREIRQRIKSITPRTAGWTYSEITETNEIENTRATGKLSYTEFTKTRSGDTLSKTIDVLQVDFNTGIMTLLVDEFVFSTGLIISYDPVNFDFVYADGSSATVPFIQEGLERTYYISELGLFSGDIGNDNSKLLARVMLDEETPMKISEGDYVLITWQIGVYALDDALYVDDIETSTSEESSTLKYVTQEEQTTLLWEEITNVDDDGNIIEEDTAKTAFATYTVKSVDFSDIANSRVTVTVDSAEGLYKGFTANFSCLTGTLFGTIESIEHKQDIIDNVVISDYYRIVLIVDNQDVYTDNPFTCFMDQIVLNTAIECSQTLQGVIEGLPDITYSYILKDITDYTSEIDTPEVQDESPRGVSAKTLGGSAKNSNKCSFRPLYYLLGTDSLPEESGYQLDDDNDLYYCLGTISELYGANIDNIYYWYSVKQDIPDSATQTVPIIYDETEYRIQIILAVDPKTNKRSLIKHIYQYNPELENPFLSVDSIVFKNIYNPNIQKG